MSLEKGLKTKGRMARQRNVLTRAERIEVLTERGEWDEERSVYGLPKLRVLQHSKRRKHAKAEAEAPAAGAPATEETQETPSE